MQYWPEFALGDGFATRDDLQRIIEDDNASAELKQPAEHLLERTEVFDLIDTQAEGGGADGYISTLDVLATLDLSALGLSETEEVEYREILQSYQYDC